MTNELSVIPMEEVSTISRQVVVESVPTLADAILEHLAEMAANGYSKSYIGVSKQVLEMFELWLKGKPLTRQAVIGFRHYMDNKPDWNGGTAQHRFSCVSRFCKWLVVAGYTQVDMSSHVRPPSIKPAPRAKRPMIEDQYRRVMAVEKNQVSRWMYCLMWNTGLAVCDAATLQWNEVDMDSATIRRVRTKTRADDRPCVIPVHRPGELWDMLVERHSHRESEEDRYPNINGKQYVHPRAWLDFESGRIGSRWRNHTVKDSGLVGSGVSFHSFRRGFISRIAKGGINPFVGCQITGHKDPKIFQHYVQTDPEFIRSEAERALSEAASRK